MTLPGVHCRRCGTENPTDASTCKTCGSVLQPIAPAPPPPVPTAAQSDHPYYAPGTIPNYLVQSILVTLCCCLPAGIPAIIYAAQVNGKLHAGDVTGALESSKNARMWCWIAFAVGIAATIVQFLIFGAQLAMIAGS